MCVNEVNIIPWNFGCNMTSLCNGVNIADKKRNVYFTLRYN